VWVEIVNPCPRAFDVPKWTLFYRGPAVPGTGNDSTLLVTLGGTIMPGAVRLYAGPGYQGPTAGGWNTGSLGGASGAVALRKGARDVGEIADAVAYGQVVDGHRFLEGDEAPGLGSGQSVQRRPFDGRDDDNGATDFVLVTAPSPGALNMP
jgi:hypothetical protein